MQRLFQVLYNVALKYVEVKTSREQQSVGRELDTYLNALGYGPAPTYGGMGGVVAAPDGGGGYHGSSDMSDAGSNSHHAAAAAAAAAHQRARSVSSARMSTPGINTSQAHMPPAGPWSGYQAMEGVSLPQQGMLLGGWFNSSQQMMGLLEDETL